MSNPLKTPSFRLDDRRALVTGGSKGIGLAAAIALVEAGAHVTIVARNLAELIAAKNEMSKARCNTYQRISHSTLDVTRSSDVTSWIASETAQYGPFNILVNNAGTNRPSRLTDVKDEDLDLVIELNIKATFFVAREIARALLNANNGKGMSGSIINVSSQMGHVGSSHRTVYCATKHAIEGMTKALAWELGPYAIRVNTICPTYIETPMTKPMLTDAAFRKFAETGTALGRIGHLNEVMGAIVFLASDAASLITGSPLMLDGGWTAR